MKRIQVIVTRVYKYDPDLKETAYHEAGATTVEDALRLDEHDYRHELIELDDLTHEVEETAVWGIIDEG